MPLVTIRLVEGRDVKQKKLLIEKVTAAVATSIDVDPEAVSVYLWEVKKENFGRGGVMRFMQTPPAS